MEKACGMNTFKTKPSGVEPVFPEKVFLACRYYRRLQKRYHNDLGLSPSRDEANGDSTARSSPKADQPESEDEKEGEEDATIRVPVYCINLLRCNMQVQIILREVNILK